MPVPQDALDRGEYLLDHAISVLGVFGDIVIQRVAEPFANFRDRFGKPLLIRLRYPLDIDYSVEFLCWRDLMIRAADEWHDNLTEEQQDGFAATARVIGGTGFSVYFTMRARQWKTAGLCNFSDRGAGS